jgi:hypothetical protein
MVVLETKPVHFKLKSDSKSYHGLSRFPKFKETILKEIKRLEELGTLE